MRNILQKQERKENSRVRKSFRKARGVVRKVNGVASKIVNNELTRTALKGGVATFVGSWSSDKSMATMILFLPNRSETSFTRSGLATAAELIHALLAPA